MSREDRDRSILSDASRPAEGNRTSADKKRTIAEFLASAGEMDSGRWESAWNEAVEHVADIVSHAPVVIFPGHFAPDGVPPPDESCASSLMEIMLLDAMESAAIDLGWGEPSRLTWRHAVALVARAWGGRLVGECAERFRVALEVFTRRGEVAIELTHGPEDGVSTLWVRAGAIELAEESCELMIPWLRRYLCDQRLPYECQRIETDDASADGSICARRSSCRVRARIA